MNRINRLFKAKKENILSIYFTAGFPELESTEEVIKELNAGDVDMLEIGIPFSDPMADGPVIQVSSQKALDNGMTLKKLFVQLKEVRSITDMPLLLMGYLNPVMQYGMEAFCEACQETGIDGVILPDLPLTVYEEEYKVMFQQYGLSNIFLITPQTSDERIRQIDSLTEGFIYMVSSASITGSNKNINTDFFDRVKKLSLNNPTVIGFGIHDKTSFQMACNHAQGAIIGTAYIKALQEGNSKVFIRSLKS